MAKITSSNPLQSQQGIVLIVSLVFLIALTAVGVALVASSTLDIKMAAATEDKVIATQTVMGASDEAIKNQVEKLNDTNLFALPLTSYPQNDISLTDADATGSIHSELTQAADCPARKQASSVDVFKCNVLRVEVSKSYGRHDNNQVQVSTGIAQQILNVGG